MTHPHMPAQGIAFDNAVTPYKYNTADGIYCIYCNCDGWQRALSGLGTFLDCDEV